MVEEAATVAAEEADDEQRDWGLSNVFMFTYKPSRAVPWKQYGSIVHIVVDIRWFVGMIVL
jgi:hypothetical protein